MIHDFIEEEAVRGDPILPANRGFPSPVGKSSSRFLQNGYERGAVPRTDGRIEHNLRSASGDQQVSVTIPPSSEQSHLSGQAIEDVISVLLLTETSTTGVADAGLTEILDRRDAGTPPVPPAAKALGSVDHFVETGKVHSADHHFPFFILQRD